MGFVADIKRLLPLLPKSRPTLFFSAPRYDIMTKIHRVIGAHGEKTLKNQGLQLPVDKFDSALSFPQPRNRL